MNYSSFEYKAKYILEYGADKTAKALASMLQHEVSAAMIDLYKYTEWCAQSQPADNIKDDHVILLKTELVGQVSGINYLLLSKNDMNVIGKSCVDQELINNEFGTFLVEFLKEIENVLAAATISEIADRLKLGLFGDVPKIEAVSWINASKVIFQEVSAIKPDLVFQCRLLVPELGISPDFLWFFDARFSERVEKIKEAELMTKVLEEK